MIDLKIVTPEDLGAGIVFNPQTQQYEVATSSLQSYLLDYVPSGAKAPNIPQGTQGSRRMMFVQNSFGYIHLDFTAVSTSGAIATLPDTAPRPTGMLEVQTHNGGTVSMLLGSNTITCSGLTKGRRYVVNLIGFFQHL